jgi:hypothetical protein
LIIIDLDFSGKGLSEKKKYRLVKWSVVCRPKDQGGFGIYDLQVKNIAHLGKWLFKLLTEDGMWQTLLKRKYVGSKALSQVFWKPGDSQFGVGLMAAKPNFFRFRHFLIKDASQIRFWEDKWLRNASHREQYPALCNIIGYKSDTIVKVMATSLVVRC